jgi:hypothetical protein
LSQANKQRAPDIFWKTPPFVPAFTFIFTVQVFRKAETFFSKEEEEAYIQAERI